MEVGLDSQLADLLAQVPHATLLSKAGEHVRPPALQPITLVVVRGIVATYKVDWLGRRQMTGLYFPGDTLSSFRIGMSDQARSITKTELLIWHAEEIEIAAAGQAPIMWHFWKSMRHEVSSRDEWLLRVAQKGALERVAFFLCIVADRLGGRNNSFEFPFTQLQIAEATGQTSVNVNRMLASLVRDRQIKRQGRKITLLERNNMRRLAGLV